MSKTANLLLLAIALTFVFSTGCKDKPASQENSAPVTPQPTDIEDTKIVEDTAAFVPAEPVIAKVINEAKASEKADSAAHDIWMTDYKAAMKKATDEKKDMLLDFSGSDWCGWCIKLDEEVFSQKEFIDAASKDYVFVMLDFPQDQTLTTPELMAQNNELKAKYGPQGFPTVYLTDAKGRPYAQTGYQAGGPGEYLAHIEQLREKKVQYDSLMAKAQTVTGDDAQKAKYVDEAIRALPPEVVVGFYREDIDTVIALDKDNKAGLRDRHRVNLVLFDAGQMLNNSRIDDAIALVDKAITDYKVTGETAQEVYYFRAIVLDANGDKAATRASLDKAIEFAPDSEMANHIKEIIKSNFTESTSE